MNKLNLEALGVQEMREAYGGGWLKEAWKTVIVAAAAATDALSDFVDGFNSVQCGCDKKK